MFFSVFLFLRENKNRNVNILAFVHVERDETIMPGRKTLLLILVPIALLSLPLFAAEPLVAPKASSAPVIDGNLDLSLIHI